MELLFWLCLLAVAHSYLLYPLWLRWVTFKKKNNEIIFTDKEDLPSLALLIAACNEEKVIAAKIESVFATGYPADKLFVFIGSDGSSDATGPIVQQLQLQHPQLYFTHLPNRSGKTATINLLAEQAKAQLGNDCLLIFTDANIIFNPETLEQLAIHFKNEEIGLVGANVINQLVHNSPIGELEQYYIGRENEIKYLEGINHGSLMGAFGACYAIRASLFQTLPTHLIVDDFYICMQVHNQKKKCIYAIEALCYEELSGNLWEEFRRKKRIATGNFQNLFIFWKYLMQPYGRLGFAFWSHKVLRWITPLLLAAAFICLLFLFRSILLYKLLLGISLLLLALAALDLLLAGLQINIKILRTLSYFLLMNVALLLGLVQFIRGNNSGAWKPTKR